MDKKVGSTIVKISLYFNGLIISSLGIAVALQSNLGVSSWDAVFAALGHLTILTIGTWSILIQFIFWCITSFLDKSFQICCIIPILIRGISLDIAKAVVNNIPVINDFYFRFLLFIVGYLLVAIGIGIYVTTGYPRLPIDGLMIAISRALKWTINKSRFLIEFTGFITAFILHGDIGVGTIIITFTIAPFISKTQNVLNSHIKKEI